MVISLVRNGFESYICSCFKGWLTDYLQRQHNNREGYVWVKATTIHCTNHNKMHKFDTANEATTKNLWHYSDVIMGAMGSQITSLTINYSTVYSDADQRKHQSSASLALVRVIHRWPVNSLHKWPVTQKMFPFDDVTMVGNRMNPSWAHIHAERCTMLCFVMDISWLSTGFMWIMYVYSSRLFHHGVPNGHLFRIYRYR